jgi:hypothetical protein
VEDFATD